MCASHIYSHSVIHLKNGNIYISDSNVKQVVAEAIKSLPLLVLLRAILSMLLILSFLITGAVVLLE